MKRKSAIPASLRKRLLALLCAVCLCVTLLPVSVLAEGEEPDEGGESYTLTLKNPLLETEETEKDVTEYTLGTPTKVDGFTFRYWEDENEQTYKSGTTITLTGGLDLTAVYTLNSGVITVGEGSYNNQAHEYTATITTTNSVLADENSTVSIAYTYSVDGGTGQEATVDLVNGSATITIKAKDQASVSIDEITSVTLNGTTYAVQENVAPELTWDESALYTDADGNVWAKEGAAITLTITGVDSELDDDATTVTLNNESQTKDETTSTASSYTYILTMATGENTIAVSASDATGNTVEETCTIRAENTAPTIAMVDDAETFYTDSDGNMWAIKADQVSFTKISDDESGLKECSAQLGTDGDPVTLTYDENTKTYTIAYSSLSTGENTITVTASDNVGNTATETFTVYKDTDAPTASKVELTLNSETGVLRSLGFGNFFNAAVTLTVTASDNNGSGLNSMTVSSSTGESTESFGEDGTASVTLTVNLLSAEKSDELTITLTDNVGNTSTTKVGEINSNLSNSFLYETKSPTVTETTDGDSYYTYTAGEGESAVKTLWVKDGKNLTFIVSDVASENDKDASGLYSTLVTVTSESGEKTVVDKTYNDSETTSATYTDTVTISYEDDLCDGENLITITVTDNAGNKSAPFTLTVYKDTAAADVSSNYQDVTYKDSNGVYWVLNEKEITITVTDQNADNATDVSGLASVELLNNENAVKATSTVADVDANNDGVYDYSGSTVTTVTYTIAYEDLAIGVNEFAVDVTDNVGNVTDTYNFTVWVDTTAPSAEKLTVTTVDQNAVEKALHILTFGIFFKEEVTLTVEASDTGSGLYYMTISNSDGTKATASFEDGTATVTLPATLLENGKADELIIMLTDHVGNASKEQKATEVPESNVLNDSFLYETYEPVAALTVGETEYTEACYKDSDGNYWVKDGETMTIAVEDVDSGLYTAEVTLNGKTIISSTSFDAKTTKQEADSTLAPGKNTIHVSAVDNAGNELTQDFVVYQDTQAPAIDSVRISGCNANRSTGAYANGDVTLTVVVNDVQSGFTSGLASAVLTYVYTTEEGGEQTRTYTMTPNEDLAAAAPGQVSSAGTVTLTYTLDADQVMNTQGSFSLTLADNVGNRATYNTLDGFGSTNLKVNSLTVENTSPQVSSVTISTPDYTDSRVQDGNGNSQAWYDSTDVQFVYTVSDQAETPYAGVAYVDITINGHALDTRTYVTDTQRQSSRIGSFNLSDSECAAYAVTGENVITIRVTDDAGNVSETYTGYVYIDADDPVVTSYSFTPANENGASTGTSVVVTDYGYFFSEDTSITVTIEDSAPSSGIAVVRFVTVSIDGTVSEYSQTVNPTSSVSQTTQATATFTVPKGFKGQIYAQAEDHVGHVQSVGDTSFTGYEGMWCRPDGVVTETQQLHDQRETHISIELLSEPVTYLDGSSNPLYNADVQVKLTVTDIYAGIQSIEYTVVSAYDTGSNQSGTLSMVYGRSSTANGTGESLQYAITQTNSDGRSWSVDREDLNLVTQMSKTLTVSNNSNDIVIYVKMTDNCGNVSEQELVLSIDKDAPVVTVSYDNNAALNDKYFNEDRVMTVTVVERNFNGAEVDCTVDGTAVSFGGSLAEWTVSGPDGDGNYTYTLTRTFHNDGDYLFAMSVTDLADNLTADAQVSYQGTATQDFVMDQTAPVISLSLNGAFSNGYYLQADSSVTVTVNEHNFDAGGYTAVARFVSASDATDTFLAAGTWSTTGDVSTVTFDVAVEGDYYIDTVTFTDLAGNEQTVTGEEFGLGYFVLDKTAPVIQILTGVGGESIDKTASQGEVTPTIVIEDYTFNSAAVEYTLTGYRNGDVTDAYAASRSDEETGCTIIYVNFDEEETVDDIYVLTVTVTDLAGNSTPASATFSVNRFGSTYMLSQDTYDTIQSTYLNEEKTITVVEINPDRLTEQSVTVTRGSNTATLTEGEDYTVEEEGPWDSQADTWNTDSHWYQYTYTIAASNFVTEGEYTISLYSEDEADNSQTNEKTRHTVNLFSGEMNTLVTSEDENPAQAQVTFVIDKTSPIVSFLNLDKSSYRASSLDVSIQATDETKIADLEIWVDGELMETVDEQTLAQDGYTYVYTMASKGQRQSIELVAHDQAGNSSVLTDDNSKSVLITTNLWIQFINSWLAITIACVVVAAAAAGIILLLWRRRKEDEETENV